MQSRFDFASGDLDRWRKALQPLRAKIAPLPRRPPFGAYVKSLISGRTRDVVSLAAYHRLRRQFLSPKTLAHAGSAAIERAIGDVTFPDAKALWLTDGLDQIARERPDFDLDFLGGMSLDAALAWLELLPGVGRKVAAATLNGSRLNRPVFIVDTHIWRVMRRLGFVGPHADARAVSELVTAGAPGWSGDDFLSFHMATKRLGQIVCRPEIPDCAACPLAFDCPSARRR